MTLHEVVADEELPGEQDMPASPQDEQPQTNAGGELNDVAALAAELCGTSLVALALINGSLQWYTPGGGLRTDAVQTDLLFCAYAICDPSQVLVVPDTREDYRFAHTPYVLGAPQVQFYAGAPLVTSTGQGIGALCVMDTRPRTLTEGQISGLQLLARMVINHLETQQLLAFKDRALQHERRMSLEIRAQLSAIGAASSDMVSFVDRRYVYRYVNDTYKNYINKPLNLIEGHPVAEILGEDAFQRTSKPLLDEALAGNPVEYGWTLVTQTKEEKHLDILYTPARDTAGNVLGVVVRARDVTKFKEMEANLRATVSSLERVNALQKEFIYILSHDLREPLNSIINFSTMLSADVADKLDPKSRRYLDFINSAGTRMRRLLDDLLSFVRLEQPQDAFTDCDLNVILSEIQQDMDSTLRLRNGTITAGEMPVLKAHPSMLRLLLQNLISNGMKFQRPGTQPHITVTAERLEKTWQISVRDNGIGIPPDKLDVIFRLFHRLNSRKDYEGSGLGLAMCRRVAMYHQGRIWAESTLGEGSVFHVELPAEAAPATADERAAAGLT